MLLHPEGAEVIDVVIPTRDNEQWLQRAVTSLIRNTNPAHLGKIIVMGKKPCGLGSAERYRERVTVVETEGSSWMENISLSETHVTTPVALYMHDDCMILPGNPDWLVPLAKAMEDPTVACVQPLSTNDSGAPQINAELCMPEGYYYTTWYCPILVLARVRPFTDAVRKMPHDIYGDTVPFLELCKEGWRVVVSTHVCQLHKGRQSNFRIHGDGKDPHEWMKEVRAETRARMAEMYSPQWLARLDACEMIPVVSVLKPHGNNMEVLM